MQPCGREMQSINSLLNQQFDPAHDEFLDQILSSVPSSWPPDLSSGNGAAATSAKTHMAPWDNLSQTHLGSLEDQSTNSLTSKLRQQQIGTAKALMFQQQLMLGGSASGNCLRSPTGNGGFMSMPLRSNGDHSDICLDGSPFDSANSANDASVQALYDQFTGSLGQPSNHLHHFQQPQGGGIQAQDMGTIAAAATMNNQSVGSGSAGRGGGGGSSAQPKQQRVRARRGQATDPHSIAERLRRERIAERMKALQELVPNANKTDKASMLDEIVDYVKFLQLQVKVLSMSRLGGAAAVNPRVADMPPQAGGVGEAVQGNGRSSNGTQTAAASSTNDTMTVTEHQVAKLMEEDMGSAMQYLQGKGLCLMPISLATAISTATCQPRSPNLLRHNNTNKNHHHPRLGSGGNGVGDGSGGPSSPNMSGLTVQSATLGNDPSVKDAASVSKP